MGKLKPNKIKATGFQPVIIYAIFNEILALAIFCYREILKKETYYEGQYNEDIFRNDFKKYLESNKSQLTQIVKFISESATVDSKTKRTKGRIDVSVIYSLSLTSEYDITLEFKRLSSNKRNHEYINGGLMDFVLGKYAEKMPFAGMIGIVEKGNINTIFEDLKKKIQKRSLTKIKGELVAHKIQSDFEHSYKSEHERNKKIGSILIYHLLFDYTGIIKNAQESLNFN